MRLEQFFKTHWLFTMLIGSLFHYDGALHSKCPAQVLMGDLNWFKFTPQTRIRHLSPVTCLFTHPHSFPQHTHTLTTHTPTFFSTQHTHILLHTTHAHHLPHYTPKLSHPHFHNSHTCAPQNAELVNRALT